MDAVVLLIAMKGILRCPLERMEKLLSYKRKPLFCGNGYFDLIFLCGIKSNRQSP